MVLKFLIILISAVWLYRTARLLKTLRRMHTLRPAPAPLSAPKVSIIVPAKNEEKNIGECITRLLDQDYPDFEIIVVNDNSTDGTAAWLEDLMKRAPAGRLKVVHGTPTPPGWTGKNFAVQAAPPQASGTWFLFTDADTRHEKHGLSTSMAFVREHGLSLLTLTPRCLTHSPPEHMIQPTAMGLVGLWFPIEEVNDPKSSMTFGNGQYLLMERMFYEKIGGHESVRGEYLEDFAIMRKAKQSGVPAMWAQGPEVYGTRMYDSWAGMWRGWRRIFLHAFEKNIPVLLGHAAALLMFSVLPFVLLCADAGRVLPLVILILVICWQTFRVFRAPGRYSLAHPIAALFMALVLLDAVRIAASGARTKWR